MVYVFIINFQTDWFTARDLCIGESAQLVAFETEEEYNAIRAAISKSAPQISHYI